MMMMIGPASRPGRPLPERAKVPGILKVPSIEGTFLLIEGRIGSRTRTEKDPLSIYWANYLLNLTRVIGIFACPGAWIIP